MTHPNVHSASREWSEEQVLHVAVAYSNPRRWESRRRLANDFRHHMDVSPNVRLHFCEMAYGDRPHELTRSDRPDDVQVRSSHELWHKENLLNIAVKNFPQDWKYGAYLDADITLTRHDWALETIHLLQHYSWVQLFSQVQYLSGGTVPSKGHRQLHTLPGFALTYAENDHRVPDDWERKAASQKDNLDYSHKGRGKYQFPGAPGGGWAFRRDAFNEVGGLLDRCILGSADSFMAFGTVGSFKSMQNNLDQYTPGYRETITAWQKRASRRAGDIFYVDQMAVHHFHGPMNKRGYGWRDQILIEEKYDPIQDVFYDSQGVLQLTSEKPRLRDRIRSYFLSRCEDIPHQE